MEKDGQQLVSKAQYAKLRGWDRSYLSKKDVKARLAPAMEKDKRGKDCVNVAKADEIFKRETDTSKVRKEMPAEVAADDVDEDFPDLPPTMDAARRENIRLKNEDLALKLAAQKGQTLERAGVIGAAGVAGQAIRENIYSLIPGLAERFATMTDAREIRTAMDAALRSCLESVWNEFMRKIEPANGGEGQPTAH